MSVAGLEGPDLASSGHLSCPSGTSINQTKPIDRLRRGFEIFTIGAAGLLLMLAVVIATIVIYLLFLNGVRTNLASISSVAEMQAAIQRVFAGVLLLLLDLELLETLKTYFTGTRSNRGHYRGGDDCRGPAHPPDGLRAYGRGDADGVGVLMAALSSSYFLLRRSAGKRAASRGSGAEPPCVSEIS